MSLVTKGNRLSAFYTDLAARRLGGQALSCSNDFFAEMENLLKAEAPVFQPGVFTERGQLMDGWESRRRRFLPDGTADDGLQYDWCIIKLGSQGIIRGINANTAHFLGNAPQQVSLEACNTQGEPAEDTEWTSLIDITEVKPGCDNLIDVPLVQQDGVIISEQVWTHVRLNMFPDGGIARLNIYGEIEADKNWFLKGEPLDLAYIKNGARLIACSDMFFSAPENILMPERGANMGDGWETKRRRSIGDVDVDRGNDWLIIQLATRGNIEKILIDTCHFKGNYPNAFALEGAVLTSEQAVNTAALTADSHLDARFDKRDSNGDEATEQLNIEWTAIIERTALFADREHTFKNEVTAKEQSFTHIRLKMYPDGGISRIRLWGFSASL
jgi:allantoicase